MRVLYAGVMKTPHYMGEEVGEYKALRRLGIDAVHLTELGRTEKIFEYALDMWRKYNLVALDELLYAVRQGFIPPTHVTRLATVKTHVVVTGGYWQEDWTQHFDVVTELREVKHPFRRGRLAVRGLDF